MAVLTTPRIPTFSKWTSETDKLLAQKTMSWLASALALILGLTLLKTALVTLLLNLYDYLIQKNMLKF